MRSMAKVYHPRPDRDLTDYAQDSLPLLTSASYHSPAGKQTDDSKRLVSHPITHGRDHPPGAQ